MEGKNCTEESNGTLKPGKEIKGLITFTAESFLFYKFPNCYFLERQLLSKARSDSSLSPAINGPMLGTEFVAGVFPVSYEHNLVPIRSHYETVKSLSRCGCVIICGQGRTSVQQLSPLHTSCCFLSLTSS